MRNLVIGVISSVVGGLLFVFSDTLFGNSDIASYCMFAGGILFLVGLVFTVIGLVQVLVGAVRKMSGKG